MYNKGDAVIFRGKPNYTIANVVVDNSTDPTYVVADKTGREYSFWVYNEDLKLDDSAVLNPS
jgi:hypothetical protein